MEKTIFEDSIIHPFFYIILLPISGFIGKCCAYLINLLVEISDTFYEDLIIILIAFYILSIINLSKAIQFDKISVKEGYYCKPFGFIKITNSILKKNILKVDMVQNEKQYFEIVIEDKNTRIIVFTIANRNPAIEQLELVKTLTKS